MPSPSLHRSPWYQRSHLAALVRARLRTAFFALVRRTFDTDDGKQILAASLRGLLSASPLTSLAEAHNSRPQPYADLRAKCRNSSFAHGAPVFITARFRSGSTLLWNIFRHSDRCTAYYEPFNERRWFDSSRRGTRTDPTHLNVTDYWREYDGLGVLGTLYDEGWVTEHLYMDSAFWNPGMRRFIEILIERAPGRPILQFNHVDFRLPWLRSNFPDARIVHLYRHPRDQWRSSLFGSPFPTDGDLRSFEAVDHFYLRAWARDLRYHFPFLDERTVSHPYQLFYYIWKLSYLSGLRYADYSLAFEDLALQPEPELRRLFRALGGITADIGPLASLVAKQELGGWKQYATDRWFLEHESECEDVLNHFLGTPALWDQRSCSVPHSSRNWSQADVETWRGC